MEAVIVIRESPEPETQEERDKVHDSVVSDAEKLIVSVERALHHCACGQVGTIVAKSCRFLVLDCIEYRELDTPELEILVLAHMPYGDYFRETRVNASTMPKLKQLVILSNLISIDGDLPENCVVYCLERVEVEWRNLKIQGTHHPNLHSLLLRYFDTPEVFRCSCFRYDPIGVDFFSFYESLLWV